VTGQRISDQELRDGLRVIATWGSPASVPALPDAPVVDIDAARRRRRLPAWWAAAAVLVTTAVVVTTVGTASRPPIASGSWVSMAPAPIQARASVASVWTGTEMVVVGGQDGQGRFVRDAAAYNPGANTWRLLPDAPIDVLPGATALWTGREVVIVFTDLVQATERPDGYFETRFPGPLVLDPVTGAWRSVPQPAERFISAATVRDGRVIVLAGTTDTAGRLTVMELGVDDTWHEVLSLDRDPDRGGSELIRAPRWVAFTVGHDIVFLCTRWMSGGLAESFPLGYVVDDAGRSARPLTRPPVLRPPLSEATTHWIGGKAAQSNDGSMLLVSHATGNGGTGQSGAAVYDSTSGAWRATEHLDVPHEDEIFNGLTVTSVGTGAIVLGGIATGYVGEGPGALRDVYSFARDRWYRLPDPGIDLERVGHVAVWTGAELVLWGGMFNRGGADNRVDTPAGDGAIYRPRGN
jgi:hypothetical protein